MKNRPLAWLLVAGGLIFTTAAKAEATTPPNMEKIPGGVFRPFFSGQAAQESETLADFWMDRDPVTVSDFLAFLQRRPEWKKREVKGVFADNGYLSHWAAPDYPGKDISGDTPVTEISWFAARAYCEAQEKTLPTLAQWEWAARAGAKGADMAKEPDVESMILGWYGKPAQGTPPPVSTGWTNFFGVRGLHGLIWEWVEDFNSFGLSSDSRAVKEGDSSQFCGGGSLAASDFKDYPAFMRYAFRSSLQGSYTTRSLGFRCVKESAP